MSLVHMNGRVFDPKLGQFMSVDPIIGDMGDSQSVNPYAYVGNRALSFTDPTGFEPLCLSTVCGTIVASVVSTALNFIFGGSSAPPPPPAISLPGPSAQNGTALCGPGATSLNCHGVIIYAGAPSTGGGDVPSSSWVNEPMEADYARENLTRFFQDLGINTVDVLILSTARNAQGAYKAVQEKEYLLAAGLGASVVCDVTLKICKAAAAPFKAAARLARSLGNIGSKGGTEIVQRAMSRAELVATRETGLIRGGREGIHYVSNSVNSSATRAQSRLALPRRPEVRVTLEVPAGRFSTSTRVQALEVAPGKILPGGGMERSAIGAVPARVLRVDEL